MLRKQNSKSGRRFLRVYPHPLQVVIHSLLTAKPDFLVALLDANLCIRRILPILKCDFFINPRMGEDGVWRSAIIRDEVVDFPCVYVQ